MSHTEIFEGAVSLPVDKRVKLVEELLKSLNPTRGEIDELWAKEAERRVDEINSGKVGAVPGENVFRKIHKRLNQ